MPRLYTPHRVNLVGFTKMCSLLSPHAHARPTKARGNMTYIPYVSISTALCLLAIVSPARHSAHGCVPPPRNLHKQDRQKWLHHEIFVSPASEPRPGAPKTHTIHTLWPVLVYRSLPPKRRKNFSIAAGLRQKFENSLAKKGNSPKKLSKSAKAIQRPSQQRLPQYLAHEIMLKISACFILEGWKAVQHTYLPTYQLPGRYGTIAQTPGEKKKLNYLSLCMPRSRQEKRQEFA